MAGSAFTSAAAWESSCPLWAAPGRQDDVGARSAQLYRPQNPLCQLRQGTVTDLLVCQISSEEWVFVIPRSEAPRNLALATWRFLLPLVVAPCAHFMNGMTEPTS